MTRKPFMHLSLLTATSALLAPPAQAAFVEDGKAALTLRNYYFNNDFRDRPGAAGQSKTAEWAQGFLLDYKSGFTDGTVGVGVDALGMLGVRLDGGGGNHRGSSMIPDDSDGSAVDQWSRLGLTGKLRFSRTEARYGTLQPKLPILVTNDGRVLPQTFEGGMITSQEFDGLTLTGGRLEHTTGRGSSNRSGLAVAGGTQESNAFLFAGADYQLSEALKLQYYAAKLEDYYVQHFGGLVHVWTLADNQSLTTDLRYFKTDADGRNDSASGRAAGYQVSGLADTPGKIDNDTWSAMFTYALGGHALLLGHQRVSNSGNFVQLNQGNTGEGAAGASIYLFTDRLVTSFTRAGERTTFGQYAYNFAALGVPGLTASVAYLKGSHIRMASGGDEQEWERDIALDYVVQDGTLKGLAFSWRNGMLRSGVPSEWNQDQNRVMVSYSLPLL
ncbi:OprD family porin [Pseudomonas guariconensis]|uniref:OprD family porin n=2 Tax=Pseudomonas TaxID=286 RepID=UPI00209AB259|nr:OprD family porin [Pseudomonas guariconensis]MCO7633581.1 OprD family porin [Pseudomonas guariconensis]